MKYIIPILFLFIITATSCGKLNDLTPTTVKPLDTDVFIHQISFNAPTQLVATKVSNATLAMIYYENINLYIPKAGYTLSYAIHLREDFTSAALIKFQFTTTDTEGDVTTDWVDDNLNNITTKTVTDTTINALEMVKVTIQRPFTFTKVYADNKSAIAEQDSILALTTDKINFSSYVYFTKTYAATATSTRISYIKSE